MIINITDGIVKYLYNEEVNLDELGEKDIKRVSYVEPQGNKWYVDFSPIEIEDIVEGFKNRSSALEYEKEYIENNIL